MDSEQGCNDHGYYLIAAQLVDESPQEQNAA
jgi:hypothetical protein